MRSFILFTCFLGSAMGYLQYTPNQANWAALNSKVFTVTGNTDHSVTGAGWVAASNFQPWDGNVISPLKYSKADFAKKICPSGDTIRGIKELYMQTKPFANPKAPTKAEVDNWHMVAINHVRKMVGHTNWVKPDYCMFARALWGQQRQYTNMWDAKYPNDRCYKVSTNAHCGATFLPSAADQKPYLPANHPACTATAGAEGISGAPKTDIPWALKWSRAFCGFLGSEGYWGGHTGPFFLREKFGFSFWDNGQNGATLRGKWTGTLIAHKYPKPAAADIPADTDPENRSLPDPEVDPEAEEPGDPNALPPDVIEAAAGNFSAPSHVLLLVLLVLPFLKM